MFLIILIFIAFSIATFLINNVWVLLGLTISNILLHFIFKISPVKALKNLLKILMFVMFFANIFKRVDELELVLRARNYNAE